MKKINLASPTEKQLKTGYLNYNTNMVVQILQNFCKSPEGANAGVMLVLPDGRNPMQKEFNIKEIKLVENKLINAAEKYRCVILVE
ncbi:MAG: hypothetical protein CM15mV53_300 [uncultured marine virus]|jgi:hypothetical protein|nr:MAG: hypothetical protein CM15mV53_300 [uncultured marine virus]